MASTKLTTIAKSALPEKSAKVFTDYKQAAEQAIMVNYVLTAANKRLFTF